MFHDALRSFDRVDKCLVVDYFGGKCMFVWTNGLS